MLANPISTRETCEVSAAGVLALESGKGAWVWDTAGQGYLDCTGDQNAAIAGHGNTEVTQAVRSQAQQLYGGLDGISHPAHAQLLDELARLAPAGMGQALLCGGECEAVRAALQFAWHYTGRTQMVLAGNQHYWLHSPLFSRPEPYRNPAGLPMPVFESVPFSRLDRLESAISTATAAVILPIVQTGDGVWPATTEYLHGVQRLCRERNALLVVDEIHTGFGVTGRRFACQHYDLQPDLLFTGTGMAAGLPLAVLFVSQRLGELPTVAYSTTLYLDPVSCAAGLAVLSFVQSNQLWQQAAELGDRLKDGLAAIHSPLVHAVQSAGLMVAIKLSTESAPYLAALAEHGVLARPAGENGIAFRPPLVISAEEIDMIIATMAHVLKNFDRFGGSRQKPLISSEGSVTMEGEIG